MVSYCHCERFRLNGRAWQSLPITARLLRHFIPRKDNLLNVFVLVGANWLPVNNENFKSPLTPLFQRGDGGIWIISPSPLPTGPGPDRGRGRQAIPPPSRGRGQRR
jgi:hypothetical protein